MNEAPIGERKPVQTSSKYKINQTAHHGCRMCGKSCRNYDVMLTPQEAHRLSLGLWLDLINEVEPIPDDLPLTRLDPTTGQYILSKRSDGRCVFLDHDNLCLVHKEAGLTTKPIACQFFPMVAIQTPDGLHISLNTGCKRLIDMNDADPTLEQSEAERLLQNVQAVTTLDEAVALTPDNYILYTEYTDLQNQFILLLTKPHNDYMQNLRDAAKWLLEISTDDPAPSLTWQSVYQSLATILNQRQPQRSTTSHLFETIRVWLPAITHEGAHIQVGPISEIASSFFSRLAHQYLEGQQVAFHRTARTGWVALLVSMVAAVHTAHYLTAQNPSLNVDHVLNESISNMLDLFFIPAGQIALTEPNQQAFLIALAAI
jgi:Fe-S-cluster containining protein